MKPSAASAPTPEPVIVCEDVWKVFGERRSDIEAVVQSRLDKTAALERHGCVIAVSGVNLTVHRGEIFC